MKNNSCVTLACAAAGVIGLAPIASIAEEDHASFGPWAAPERLGAPNTAFAELCPFVSKDGLSLYFFSNRPGGSGANDLWVSRRSDTTAEWEAPQNLAVLNTPFNEHGPWLSRDGHALYFNSDRPLGHGGLDLYVSRRRDKHDDLAWEPPVNLGSSVNGPANDISPSILVNESTDAETLYFTSDRPGGAGGDDVYSSIRQDDGSFGPPTLVAALSSPAADRLPSPRHDGLEIFITSNRPGGRGALDLWVATRESAASEWSTPVNLGPEINSIETDGCARLTDRDTTLYFHSTRFGGQPLFDLFISERDKARREDD